MATAAGPSCELSSSLGGGTTRRPCCRLDFAHVTHCGRQDELQRLTSIYFASCRAEHPTASSVIIQAASGLGKTALVEAFVEQVIKDSSHVLIGRGKFEEATAASEPFAAIIAATNDVMQQLARSEERSLWIQLIKEALTSDTRFLADIIPGLSKLIFDDDDGIDDYSRPLGGKSSSTTDNSDDAFTLDGFGDMTDKEWRFERFRLGLRTLLRCISIRKPVLFVLDDMHWAEKDSVTVIWTIMEDTFPNRRLMIVGASRPIQASQHLSLMMEQVKGDLLSSMNLEVLPVKDVTRILALLLRCHPEDVQSLGHVVHKKCNGNTFVILQFIRISEQQRHIYYSEKEEKWVWDEAAIEAHSNIAETVIDVVANKLLSVDPERKAALITAACFGTSHFEVDTIVHAMKLMREDDGSLSADVFDDEAADYDEVDPYVVRRNITKLKETLRNAAKDGLVLKLSDGHFRFSHDRIREAAYSLLPEGLPRTKLHLKIGRQLRSWMETQSELIGDSLSEESLLLNATNQLNQGAALIEDDWERLDLAELNYQAAEHSARKSSFVPAMEFLQRGIQQLGENRWEKHYNLTIKLTVALTRIQFCCGMYEACQETAQQVIVNGQSLLERKPAYHTQCLALLHEEQQEKATEFCLKIMEDVSVRFPRKFLLLKGLAQHAMIDKKLRNLSSSELMNLPDARDPDGTLEFSLGLNERLIEISYHGGDDGYLVHVNNKQMLINLEQGRHSQSAMTFIGWGYVKAIQEDFEEAIRVADVGLYYATERRFGAKDARAEYVYSIFIRLFKTPIPELVEVMNDLLEEQRSIGAIEMVLMDGYFLQRYRFLSGMPLTNQIEKCAEYNEMLLDYRQPIFWSINAPLTQAILNLMGHTDDSEILTGEHMDEERHLNLWKETNNKNAIGQYYFFKLFLATLFRNYDSALEISNKMPSWTAEGFTANVPFSLFYKGLALIAVSKKKRLKRSIRRREVYKIMKKLSSWSSYGFSCCKHMELILRAEVFAAIKQNRNEIESAYRLAIETAKLSGIIQNEALANELAGSWMAEQTGKEECYSRYLVKAATLYEAWGGAVKVDDIMRRFPECFGEQATFQYKSSRTMPMTGSFSSSMWSTSLCVKSIREPLKSPVESTTTSSS